MKIKSGYQNPYLKAKCFRYLLYNKNEHDGNYNVEGQFYDIIEDKTRIELFIIKSIEALCIIDVLPIKLTLDKFIYVKKCQSDRTSYFFKVPKDILDIISSFDA